jgi:FKBP-type peptidyl-prolyl cis-trans isomerase
MIAALSFAVACKNVAFKKTKSGLTYKIFPGGGKDSLIKDGQIVKFNYTISYNDSLMDRFNSYGKMPGYVKVQGLERSTYDLQEILTQLKKGDSAVTVQIADTLAKQQSQLLPPNWKPGSRITTTLKITEVFSTDSVAMADVSKEREKDMPRQLEEEKKQMEKAQKDREEQVAKEYEENVKSGEVAKELKEMEAWLAAKKINAQKTGKGTYVVIQEQGTGPQAENNKYVNVKYAGKLLTTDSLFQANSYSFQLGKLNAIAGWDEGLLLFKQGGKGTLYIPGFLAYGKNPSPGSPFKPFEPLKFDIELLQVSDSAIAPEARGPRQ